MTSLNTILSFAVLLAAGIRCYTITNEDPVLPKQKLLNDSSFLRILPNDEAEIVTCPSGTYLEKTSLTCQFDTFQKMPSTNSTATIPGSDAHPNPENCETFFLIGAAGQFILNCSPGLLFNEETGQCDWPLQAGCCEYKEKNSSRIVQNI